MFSLIFSNTMFLIQTETPSFFTQLFNKIYEGGLFFMLPIVIIFALVLSITIKNIFVIVKKGHSSVKFMKLINSIGLLALVWGVLGQLIGLVTAFDRLEMLGEVSIEVLARGLKISALPTIFGFFTFSISRAITIIFLWIQKEH
ncbi:MotA/TolQ/ExbB proton channel family protein [Aquimarina algicola]|uniref:MotA/TolQ/ExbB proton channel family protein n=2 Tax=Aquimarina algicola TaxID=2589995 RepID=A0A504J2B9_9FLAO|nr:MotA/TolQ/ExbB proton channel family protein [Aquimarina algicola]